MIGIAWWTARSTSRRTCSEVLELVESTITISLLAWMASTMAVAHCWLGMISRGAIQHRIPIDSSPQHLGELPAIHHGHAHIQQHPPCGLALEVRQGLLAIRCRRHLIPLILEECDQRRPNPCIVLDHQDTALGTDRGLLSRRPER